MAHTLQKFDRDISSCLSDPWELSYNCLLTEEFIDNNLDKIDWYAVLIRQKLSEKFLRKHLDTIYRYRGKWGHGAFDSLVAYQRHTESFLEELMAFPEFDKCWAAISCRQKLSESFMRKYKDKLDWNHLCHFQKMSEDFMEEHLSSLDMKEISRYQNLSPTFLEKHFDKLVFGKLLKNKKLSAEAKKVLIKNSRKIVTSLLTS